MDIEITVKHETAKHEYKRVSMQISKYEYDFAKYKGEVLQSIVDRLLETMQKEIEKYANTSGNKV